MPRPRKHRRIRFEPEVTYYKPAGVPLRMMTEVVVTAAELEALRLTDGEQKDQQESAQSMGISQPTFHRLLKDARTKTAQALCTGKAIRIEHNRQE